MQITSTSSSSVARSKVSQFLNDLRVHRPTLPNNEYPSDMFHPYGTNPPYEHTAKEEGQRLLSLLKAHPEGTLGGLISQRDEQAQSAERLSNVAAVGSFLALGTSSLAWATGLIGGGATAVGVVGGLGLGVLSVLKGQEANQVRGEQGQLQMWDKALQNPEAERTPITVLLRSFSEIHTWERERLGLPVTN